LAQRHLPLEPRRPGGPVNRGRRRLRGRELGADRPFPRRGRAGRDRLACHPHDPYTPPGYRGVTRVLGTVEGLKRFVEMHESPYHGLNFCQGTIAEMLDDPPREIFAVIRWF